MLWNIFSPNPPVFVVLNALYSNNDQLEDEVSLISEHKALFMS